jgi:hypothetical protein
VTERRSTVRRVVDVVVTLLFFRWFMQVMFDDEKAEKFGRRAAKLLDIRL